MVVPLEWVLWQLVLCADITTLDQIINDYAGTEICQISNDNIYGQIEISGHNASVERVIAILKDLGYKAIKLKDSAPYHCELMQPQKMAEALLKVTVNKPIVPVITDVTATSTSNPVIIKQNLITQICGRVRWREMIDQLVQDGVKEIVELGSGKILTGMIKRTNHTLLICVQPWNSINLSILFGNQLWMLTKVCIVIANVAKHSVATQEMSLNINYTGFALTTNAV